MKVLVTGAKGFVGRNLCEALNNIASGKDRREKYQNILPLTVYEYDRDGTQEELSFYCSAADFVFNLAGINRPKDPSEFMEGNMGFGETLLSLLEHHGNKCPVMLSSSVQASLEGRYAGSPYGESKLAGEELLFDYEGRTGAKALVYRFPNLYGKWCRPRYNSAVATFCDAIANGREFQVNDPSVELELLYIDDLVTAMLDALVGDVRRCRYAGAECVPAEDGRYCYAPGAQKVSLGEIVGLLESFRDARETLAVPNLKDGSFSKKLYSTFLSYYEPGSFAYDLKPNVDARGSFTEFLRTPERGQVSVNVSKPGIAKGNHWHMSKWEKFLVVSGTASIKLRKVGEDTEGNPYPVDEYVVRGEDMRVVEMIPGYTHSITNLSDTDDLVTVMWANEPFDPDNPDTYYEEV
ncbi:polysaccharide biosynthesis C-terminal domain-containing protein [Senegalimassilia anaerobia]|uniref:polysaccharide biosynthesis C-terminal domain-containing protein n=1 Tax=Senegalimassilia anaerobia TaxID=1473216 RepID=UPI0026738854|nr:NAD-dependent epimerase/dehydratase family protein [Senegalimassilia anaerobia]